MNCQHIERIINLQFEFDQIHRVVADHTAGQAENDAAKRADRAGGWCDGRQAGNCAGDQADDAGFAEPDLFNHQPDERC